MPENTSLEILKHAILLEKRGEAFYGKVAGQTDNEDVKRFFSAMAREEALHISVLSEQYKACSQGKPFVPHAPGEQSQAVEAVLTDEMKATIASADFEAAAISAAISMEEKAVKLYSEREKATTDPEEKALYAWLADWERGHLELLMDIDRSLIENIWNDNNFWPF